MGFKVITDADGSFESFDGSGDKYSFNHAGLLVTVRGDSKTQRIWSPYGWRFLEEDR